MILATLAIAGHALDVLTTHVGLERGFGEKNPLFVSIPVSIAQKGMYLLLIVSLGVTWLWVFPLLAWLAVAHNIKQLI